MKLAPVPFDITGPLPTGTSVLEASAGTGKTYTVGALVTRYVAEGVATLDELLVVTFGRAASQELRDRIRRQLVDAHRALADPEAARQSAEPLIRTLAGVDDEQLRRRRERLTRALADFDAATIATTHQFCQQVLSGLGIAGDSDPGTVLVEDLDDLVVEVVDDLYVRGFAGPGAGHPEFDRATALQLGRAALLHPDARLEPADADPNSVPAKKFRFAHVVRTEVEVRKRRMGVLSYDDLLSRLAAALESGSAARERMRERWKVVLIDEFQDTDPVQWQVLQRAFSGATLILIGDPKQAIYAFRGGDVVTYLTAAGTANTHVTLERNWRADAPLVAALQVLFDGAELGDPRIAVLPVSAQHSGSRLAGAPSSAPVRLRQVRRDQLQAGPRSTLKAAQLRPFIAQDVAADIAGLLTSGASFDGRPLAAGDIAVLVNTHSQGELIREHLSKAGIASVTSAAGSVFAAPAGEHWLTLLEALEQPHRAPRVRAAALTPFLGYTAAGIDSGGDDLTEELGGRLRDWADLLGRRGVAALAEAAAVEQDLPGRVLRLPDGERLLTDLRHVGQALQRAATDSGLGLAALVEWLRRRRSESSGELPADRVRRLDSDAAAVQVLTVHVSKGLQFPVVYLPFAADRWMPDDQAYLQLHDQDGNRLLDVGGDGSPGRRDRRETADAESAGEALRLLYVALTRAQSQVVTWWAPSFNARISGLHRILFGRRPGGRIADAAAVPGDDEATERLNSLQRSGGPAREDAGSLTVMTVPTAPAPEMVLDIAGFDRELDLSWRRASYSSLAAAAEQAVGRIDTPSVPGVSSERDTDQRDDESEPGIDGAVPGGVAIDQERALLSVPSPMADLPTGTGFGSLVHAVLETVNPQAADLAAELRLRTAEQLQRWPAPVTAEALAAALESVLTTPLGQLAAGRSLAELAVADRLAELDFEFPLAGGDRSGTELRLADLAPLLRSHLPADDPITPYADQLAAPGLAEQPLRGYLTGSLDAVFRLPGPTYLVADYKTNYLGDPDGAALTAWHYRPEALRQAMNHSHYPLQALLYAVALHRFLRWRQPGYDPDVHLGGVLYLYLRGMCGPDTPTVGGQSCGVFGWRPPGALVTELSDRLDQGGRR